MNTIQLPTPLHRRLASAANQRGENIDEFVQDLLAEFLDVMEGPQPKSLAAALTDARARILENGTPLIHSWQELEQEVAERRGSYFEN